MASAMQKMGRSELALAPDVSFSGLTQSFPGSILRNACVAIDPVISTGATASKLEAAVPLSRGVERPAVC